MLLTGPFAMLSKPSICFSFATMYGRLPHPSLPTMAIATLAIATVSLGGTISLCYCEKQGSSKPLTDQWAVTARIENEMKPDVGLGSSCIMEMVYSSMNEPSKASHEKLYCVWIILLVSAIFLTLNTDVCGCSISEMSYLRLSGGWILVTSRKFQLCAKIMHSIHIMDKFNGNKIYIKSLMLLL